MIGNAKAAVDRIGPHRTGEAVGGIVGHGHGIVLVVERQDSQHGAEHLVLHEFTALVAAGDHGGPQEEPLAVEGCSAGDHRGAGRASTVDEPGHAVAVLGGDERADVGVGVERVAGANPVECGGDGVDELLVRAALDVDACGGRAVLP